LYGFGSKTVHLTKIGSRQTLVRHQHLLTNWQRRVVA
jgi:hypothetical protein